MTVPLYLLIFVFIDPYIKSLIFVFLYKNWCRNFPDAIAMSIALKKKFMWISYRKMAPPIRRIISLFILSIHIESTNCGENTR